MKQKNSTKNSKVMKTAQIAIILAIAITLTPSIMTQASKGFKAIMISELWRHGARSAAINTYNQSYVTKVGPGNLEGNGLRMHYNLGAKIRSLYPYLFDESRNFQHKVFSSDYERTIISAQSHLLGLYPPGTGPDVTNQVNSTKLPPFKGAAMPPKLKNEALPDALNLVPVDTMDIKTDLIFLKGMNYVCPGTFQSQTSSFASKVKSTLPLFSDISKLISAKYPCEKYYPGCKQYDLNTTGIFSNVNLCYYFYNGKDMDGVDETTRLKLDWAYGAYYIYMKNYDDEMTRKLYTTTMAGSVVSIFDKKIAGYKENNTDGLRFYGLSGHETNIIPFLLGYNLTSVDCMLDKFMNPAPGNQTCHKSPGFAADLIWELSIKDGAKNPKDFFVKMMYNGVAYPACAKTFNGTSYCTYQNFKNYLNEFFILAETDLKKACVGGFKPVPTPGGNGNPGDDHLLNNAFFWISIVLIVGIAVLVIMMFTCLQKARRQNILLAKDLSREFEASNIEV